MFYPVKVFCQNNPIIACSNILVTIQADDYQDGFFRSPLQKSDVQELYNNLNVIRFSLESLSEIFRFYSSGDKLCQPFPVSLCKGLARTVPLTLIGIDTTDYHGVPEDSGRSHICSAGLGHVSSVTHTRETEYSVRAKLTNALFNYRAHSGAFNYGIGFESISETFPE